MCATNGFCGKGSAGLAAVNALESVYFGMLPGQLTHRCFLRRNPKSDRILLYSGD